VDLGSPAIDAIVLLLAFLWMRLVWWKAAMNAEEKDAEVRSRGAAAITNQVNGMLTAASIVAAGIGAMFAIGLQNLPPTTRSVLVVAGSDALVSLVIGVWILGYITSVQHRLDVTRKAAVQLACWVEVALIALASVRFILALWSMG